MKFCSMEQFEIMGDAMEEVAAWEAMERDMETEPFILPGEETIEEMFKDFSEHYPEFFK